MTDDDGEGGLDAHGDPRARPLADWERDQQEIDFSANSAATDPEHAAQDMSTDLQTNRHGYTDNATFADGEMDAQTEGVTLNELNRNFRIEEYGEDPEDIEIRSPELEQREQNRRNDCQMWGRQIGLTDFEVQRAIQYVNAASDGWMNNTSVEAVILSALTLAANENPDGRADLQKSIRLSTPSTGNTELVENYETLRETLDIKRTTITQTRRHLREQTR
jgi:hypothetical protein